MFTSRNCLNEQLDHFRGTGSYTPHCSGWLRLTDGIEYMKNVFGLKWLVDKVAQHAYEFRNETVQRWELSKVARSNSFHLTCMDGSDKLLYKEIIGYPECNYNKVVLYVRDHVMLLPSEN